MGCCTSVPVPTQAPVDPNAAGNAGAGGTAAAANGKDTIAVDSAGVITGRLSGATVSTTNNQPASTSTSAASAASSTTTTGSERKTSIPPAAANGGRGVPALQLADIAISESLTPAAGASTPSASHNSTSGSTATAAADAALSQTFFNRVFARYIPFCVRDRFELNSSVLHHHAEMEKFEGAVAFVDISGFTKLSEWLVVKHGRDIAAEKLNLYISGYFDRLLDVIIEHGGDILKFAGDAMLVCWRANRTSAQAQEITPVPWKPGTGLSIGGASGNGEPNSPLLDPSTAAAKPNKLAAAVAAGDRKKNDSLRGNTTPRGQAAAAAARALLASGGAPPPATIVETNTPTPAPATGAAAPSTSAGRASDHKGSSAGAANKYHAPAKPKLAPGEFLHTYSNNPALAQLVYKAAACNLALLNQHNNFRPTGTAEINLTLHTGLGCGVLSGLYVGGVEGMWEYFIGGEPIHQMSEAGEVAASGEVMLSPQCYELIKGWVTAGHTHAKSKNFALQGLAHHDTDPAVLSFGFEQPPAGPDSGGVPFVPPLVTEKEEKALNHFIPPVVKKRMLAGQDSIWLSEFRKVCILFVALPGLDYDNDPNILRTLEDAVCAVQDVVVHFEGSVARLLADDKGTRFKIAFGMPTLTHEDDPVRVVLAGLEIQKRLKELNVTTAIGIATGTVYCGEAGSSKRCEYTAVGLKVNLAARLMQNADAAHTNAGMLVDQDTYDLCGNELTFEILPRIPLKGIAAPVPIFRPIGRRLKDAPPKPSISENKASLNQLHSPSSNSSSSHSPLSNNAVAGGTALSPAAEASGVGANVGIIHIVPGVGITASLSTAGIAATSGGAATSPASSGATGSASNPHPVVITKLAQPMKTRLSMISRFRNQPLYSPLTASGGSNATAPVIPIVPSVAPLMALTVTAPPLPPLTPNSRTPPAMPALPTTMPIIPTAMPVATPAATTTTTASGTATVVARPKRSAAELAAAAAAAQYASLPTIPDDAKSLPATAAPNGSTLAVPTASNGFADGAGGNVGTMNGFGQTLRDITLLNTGAAKTGTASLASLANNKTMSEQQLHGSGRLEAIGRGDEKQFLEHLLHRVMETGTSQTVVLEGDGGIGKSCFLLDFLANSVEPLHVRYLFGGGESLITHTPYFAYHQIYQQLLAPPAPAGSGSGSGPVIDARETPSRRTERIHTLLTTGANALEANLIPLLPLLNPIINTTFPENSTTSSCTASRRLKYTERLLIEIMSLDVVRYKLSAVDKSRNKSIITDYAPRVCVVEDVHSIDIYSWSLAFLLSKTVKNTLFVLSTRPLPRPFPASYNKILRLKYSHRLLLDVLSPAAVISLACRRLNVRKLPIDLQVLLLEKSQGHPVYIEEVCKSMLESKMIQVTDQGECIQLAKKEDLLTDTVQGVMVGRVDRLPLDIQLTLKVLSVIGVDAHVDLLKAIHPSKVGEEEIQRQCAQLVNLGFLAVGDDPNVFSFKHGYIREAAHSMMSVSQRKILHAAAARYYESTYGGTEDGLEHYYTVLAHHTKKAEEWSAAIRYRELAGGHAMANNSNHEAVKMFESMESIMKSQNIVDATRRQFIDENLGAACYGMGRHREAIARLTSALAGLGHPVPDTERQLSATLLKTVVKEFFVSHPSAHSLPTIIGADGKDAKAANHHAHAQSEVPHGAAGGGSHNRSSSDVEPLSPITPPPASPPLPTVLVPPLALNLLGGGAGSSSRPPSGAQQLASTPSKLNTGTGNSHSGGGDDDDIMNSTNPGTIEHLAAALSGDHVPGSRPATSASTASTSITGASGQAVMATTPTAHAQGAPPSAETKEKLAARQRRRVPRLSILVSSTGQQVEIHSPHPLQHSSSVAEFINVPGSNKHKPATPMSRAIHLLELCIRACLLNGQYWKAAYCALQMSELSEALQLKGLICLAYGHCACALIEVRYIKLAMNFHNKARAILADHGSAINEQQRAYIYFQDASVLVYRGAWSDALALLRASKELLQRSESHKKLREVLYLEMYVLYHTASYADAMRACEELIESAVADGDLYYECNGFYWKSLLLLTTEGASRDIEANLHNVQTVADDLHLSAFYRHAFDVLYLTNDFYLHHHASAVHEWLDKHFNDLVAAPNKLVHHAPLFVGLCTLIMDCAQYGGIQLKANEKKAFIERAGKAVDTLKEYATTFPYAAPFVPWLVGRLYWIRQNADKAAKEWTQSIEEGKTSGMPFLVAMGEYELGAHRKLPESAAAIAAAAAKAAADAKSDSKAIVAPPLPNAPPALGTAERAHLERAWQLCKSLGIDYLLHPHLNSLKFVDPDATRKAKEKKMKLLRVNAESNNKPRGSVELKAMGEELNAKKGGGGVFVRSTTGLVGKHGTMQFMVKKQAGDPASPGGLMVVSGALSGKAPKKRANLNIKIRPRSAQTKPSATATAAAVAANSASASSAATAAGGEKKAAINTQTRTGSGGPAMIASGGMTAAVAGSNAGAGASPITGGSLSPRSPLSPTSPASPATGTANGGGDEDDDTEPETPLETADEKNARLADHNAAADIRARLDEFEHLTTAQPLVQIAAVPTPAPAPAAGTKPALPPLVFPKAVPKANSK